MVSWLSRKERRLPGRGVEVEWQFIFFVEALVANNACGGNFRPPSLIAKCNPVNLDH